MSWQKETLVSQINNMVLEETEIQYKYIFKKFYYKIITKHC